MTDDSDTNIAFCSLLGSTDKDNLANILVLWLQGAKVSIPKDNEPITPQPVSVAGCRPTFRTCRPVMTDWWTVLG